MFFRKTHALLTQMVGLLGTMNDRLGRIEDTLDGANQRLGEMNDKLDLANVRLGNATGYTAENGERLETLIAGQKQTNDHLDAIKEAIEGNDATLKTNTATVGRLDSTMQQLYVEQCRANGTIEGLLRGFLPGQHRN
jgi:ABC-type transporter Mla subunit MlaD